jgi:hypothetical protein
MLMYRQIDIVSSELIKVMVSRRKEGSRAISNALAVLNGLALLTYYDQ